jgi:hypothetical protein
LPDTGDLSTATALGWTAGIPDVEIRVVGSGGDTIAAFQSDSAGRVDLTGLPVGSRSVWFRRWLSAGERARSSVQDDALGFVAKLRSAVPTQVFVPASRKGTLQFVQWGMVSYWDPITGPYDDGGYVVIGNNADTTIYLDRVLIGVATSQPYEIPGARCQDRIAFYSDPAGLWSAQVYQFPGTGTDHPILPGSQRVIATDAIDHRAIIPAGYDLHGADFEFQGSADVDNPAVPNVVSVGLREALGGHGLRPSFGISVWYLALPTDLASLPRGVLPGTSATFLRIPAERVLNVVSHLDVYDYSLPLCNLYVNGRFDRRTASLLEPSGYGKALHRLQSGVRPDVHWQWTKSTDADFIVAPGRPDH